MYCGEILNGLPLTLDLLGLILEYASGQGYVYD
jgi:hypothetical protein